MPDGPIIKAPELPWTQSPSVFDSALTRAMRAINDLLGGNDPNSIMGIVGTLDVPGGAGALQKAVGGLVERAKKGIKAYHGSPHDFERFDVSKIGTGEGAQAYGHGLYFAEEEAVAKQYRDALTSRAQAVGDVPSRAKFWAGMYGSRDAGIAHLERVLRSAEQRPQNFDPADVDQTRAALEYLRSGGDLTAAGGRMYEVAIDADPEDFLDWDKPLSQQSEKVKAALLANPRVRQMVDTQSKILNRPVDPKGQNAYAYATGWKQGVDLSPGQAAAATASSELRAAGVPGIKYLDAGSRTAGEGSRNYVVFDDKLVSILRKYGVAGAVGAGYTMEQVRQAQRAQGGGQ